MTAAPDATEIQVPEVWGIVNVTPDSFSDGGDFLDPARAIERGRRLAADGADVLDVGGESTRPGADPVPESEEIRRVLPVVEALAGDEGARVSIDTRRTAVARAALQAGASIVNDVSAGADAGMFDLVAERDAGLVLMHMRGSPADMQQDPRYQDVVSDIGDRLAQRVEAAAAAGVVRSSMWIDPGIGFGKTLEHNVALLRNLEALARRVPDVRVLLGASRKSFLGTLTGGRPARARLAGSLACAARAFDAGIAAVRVHDVAETRDFLRVLAALRR